MKSSIALVFVAASILGGSAPEVAAQDLVDGFVARSFKGANGDTMPYRLFVPDATARTKPLPLILYLHGGGGVGRDNQRQISGGNTTGTHSWTTTEAQRKHPAFVLAPQLVVVFVFGSIAKGDDTASSDVDLFVVSDSLTFADLFGVLDAPIRTLGRQVNPVVYSQSDLRTLRREKNSFVERVMEQPKIWIHGDEGALSAR